MSDTFDTTWDSLLKAAVEGTEEERAEFTEDKYKAGEIVWLKPTDLQFTKWNPHKRQFLIGPLKESILRVGQVLVPLIIDTKGNLIEGNRRVNAVRLIRLENARDPKLKDLMLPCFVVEQSRLSKARMFDEINGESRKQIGTAMALSVFVKNAEAVAPKLAEKSQRFVKFMGGKENTQKFVDLGGSLTYWNAIQTIKERGVSAQPFDIGMWLLKNGIRHKAKFIIKNFSAKEIDIMIKNHICPDTKKWRV